MGKCTNCWCQIFSWFNTPKTIKIGYFLTELYIWKIKRWRRFGDTVYYRRMSVCDCMVHAANLRPYLVGSHGVSRILLWRSRFSNYARRAALWSPKGRKRERCFGRGHPAPSHQLGSLGSAVNSSSRVRGSAPAAQRFSYVLSSKYTWWRFLIHSRGLELSVLAFCTKN